MGQLLGLAGGLGPQRGAPPAVQTQPGDGQGRGHSPGTCAGRHAPTRHELTPVQTACAARPGWSRHLCRHTRVHTHADMHTRVHTLGPASLGREVQQESLSPIPTPVGWQPPPCAHVSQSAGSCCSRGKHWAGCRAGSRQSPGRAGRAAVGRGTPEAQHPGCSQRWGQGWGRGASTWDWVLPCTLYQPDGVGWMWGPAQPRAPIAHLLQPTQPCCPISGATSGPAGPAGSPPGQQRPPSPAPMPSRSSVYTRRRFLAAVAETGTLITGPAALSGLGGSGLREPPPSRGLFEDRTRRGLPADSEHQPGCSCWATLAGTSPGRAEGSRGPGPTP